MPELVNSQTNQAIPAIPLPLGVPVEQIDTGSDHDFGPPEPGIGLCLSGGGYRAMLFHLGAIWRLNDLGYLPKLDRISSVSGGSITAGLLGLKWQNLDFDQKNVASNFELEIVQPIRKMGSTTIDELAIITGLLAPEGISKNIIAAYKKNLLGDATLQDLPDRPRFIFNSTNIQSSTLWRFMKPYMRDYRVGEVKNPTIPLAVAVAASSAFPPFLSPVRLDLKPEDFTPNSGKDLQFPPYTTEVYLSDGGVYDNLGLETVWKRLDTVLISDAGGSLQSEPKPAIDWPRHTYRTLELIDNQVRALRVRQVMDAFSLRERLQAAGEDLNQDALREVTRKGTYWGIWTKLQDYGLNNALDCPLEKSLQLASAPTRLKNFEPLLQQHLINWGYAVCDASMRRHVDPTLPPPLQFPYADVGIG